MRALGKTILLTTHYMEEAEQLADRICILRQGLVVAEGTPQSLRAATDGRTRVRFTLPDRTDVSALAPAVTMRDGLASLETTTPAKTLHDLTAWALERNLELADLEVTRPSLEDVYLELTAHE